MPKHLILFLLIFTACRDQYAVEFNPYDAAQIEGLWRAEMHPHRFWHFSDGVLHQQVFDFGQQVIEHWYGYETRADTVFLREMLKPDEGKILTAHFDNDSTVTLTDRTNLIQANHKLKRF